MSTKGFLIEILLHIYHAQQKEVISSFLFSFITHEIWEHLIGVFTVSRYIFKVLFNDYDITALKIIYPITFRSYTKHPIKVLRNKNNIMYMQPFYKTVPALHLNIFVPNVFNKRNLPEIQDNRKTFCLAFNHTKESVFSKNAVRLLNKTVSII